MYPFGGGVVIYGNYGFIFSAQGKISDQVSQVFGISYDFLGSVFSNVARVSLDNNWARSCENVHRRSLISTFVVRCLDSMICILAISKVSRF